MKLKAKILNGLLGGALLALPAAGLTSCNLVKEDLDPCSVAELRFIYEYNMEFANAFHKQVDCLEVFFFDGEGKLVTVETVTEASLLSDENYRMRLELPEGDYHVVAYGGQKCDKSSFRHVNELGVGDHYTDLHVQMSPNVLTDRNLARLHNHFYGSADFSVDYNVQKTTTVEMMRNTNSIQVALQHTSGAPIDYNDFTFEITDDNNDFDCENNLLATGEIKYIPWNTENRTTGTVSKADGSDYDEFHAALASFMTSRLVYNKPTSTTLHVKRATDGETVFKVPLVNYMLMFKHDRSGNGMDNMGDQEYLDRENAWNFVFFLDSDNMWVNTRIIVNDWEVRLNNTEM